MIFRFNNTLLDGILSINTTQYLLFGARNERFDLNAVRFLFLE